jgi:hypothetical protein
MVSPAQSHCRHGSAVGVTEKHEREVVVTESIEMMNKHFLLGRDMRDHRLEWAQAYSETMQQFWSKPKHARLIDAEIVRFCVARASEAALSGNRQLLHGLAWLGIYLVT